MDFVQKQKVLKLLRVLAAALWVGVLLFLALHVKEITPERIAALTPENRAAAFLLLLPMFACKSFSVLFPMKVMEMAVGLMFPLVPAIFVNLAGAAVCVSTGYALGRFLGGEAVQRITAKHEKLSALLVGQREGVLLFAVFLRCLLFLPMDAVSMYFGAARAQFSRYLLGSMIGLLPNVILSTLLGSSLTDPTSPTFLLSLLIFAVFGAVSFLCCYYYMKRHQNNKTEA